MTRFLALIFITMFVVPAAAQKAALTGIVSDAEGHPLNAVSVRVDALKQQALTGKDGGYRLSALIPGAYVVRFSIVGFIPVEKEIRLFADDTTRLSVVLQADKGTLKEVTVLSKSSVAVAREQPENIAVIDARKYYNRPEGAISILNQTAGVKVRQNGGLGSYADFYINGLSGKQVKFFVDGIPLSYLGAGMNLNILPINIIERIEIYKGVVPVKLGADALGGAIDIITRNAVNDYVDASYSFGSFNTHQATLNLRKKISPLLFASTTAFYNYSDNSYKVDVELPVAGRPIPYRAKRFHDAYSNYYANVTLGIAPRKWADELSIFSAVSGIGQQIQNNRMMTQPFGTVTYDEHSWNTGIIYKKAEIGGRLSVNAFIGINKMQNHFVDTSLNTYLWNGESPAAYRRSSGGESGPIQKPITDVLTRLARVNLHYQLNETSSLIANALWNDYNQKDDNPLTQDYPVKLHKIVTGMAFQKEFPQLRLTSVTALKYYDYTTEGYTLSPANSRTISAAYAGKNRLGVSQALRWHLNDSLLLKASYEYATRLPDELELFGTYKQRVYPNPGLLPEVSHNINLGAQYHFGKTRIEVNAFYRMADNIIFSPPSSSPFYVIYRNLLRGQITGVDGEIHYNFLPSLKLTVNATWQNYISKTSAENSGTGGNDSHYNERLPNLPFLFANGELMFTKPSVFKKEDQLSVWYNAGYVHWFYLYWSDDGAPNQKLTIPTQLMQTCGASYAFKNGRYAISCNVNNLSDTKAYDNYGVQRPGRSLQVKIRAFIQ